MVEGEKAGLPRKIVNGGQTGVDTAALEFALRNDIPYGGWIPKGRRNENGCVPKHFDRFVESDSQEYEVRTRLNVRDSDATAIITDGSASPGTELTMEVAAEFGRPCGLFEIDEGIESCAEALGTWLDEVRPLVLNVAGPRESEAPGIQAKAEAVLEMAIGKLDHPNP